MVIAAGGGGIPVLKQGMELKGASAIIEKDYASGRLAEMVDADILLILTKDENLWLNYETEKAVALHEVTVDEVKKMIADNEFPKASKLPKVQAAVDFFIEEKKSSGRKAVITDLAHAMDALTGKLVPLLRSSFGKAVGKENSRGRLGVVSPPYPRVPLWAALKNKGLTSNYYCVK